MTAPTGTAITRPNLTDVGNGQRFALQHGQWVRYCWPWRSWLLWTGTHWRRDPGDGVLELAKATARAIYLEAGGAASPDDRERLARWAVKSENEKLLRAMLALAQSEPGIPVLPDQLDADPWALNVANGTVDLRTGDLRPHRREDLKALAERPDCRPPIGANGRPQIWRRGLGFHDDTRDDLADPMLAHLSPAARARAEARRLEAFDRGVLADYAAGRRSGAELVVVQARQRQAEREIVEHRIRSRSAERHDHHSHEIGETR